MVMMVVATLCCMIDAKPGLRWPWREAKEATSAQAINYKKQFKPLTLDVSVKVDTAQKEPAKAPAPEPAKQPVPEPAPEPAIQPVPEPVPGANRGLKPGMNPQWFIRHN